MYLYSSTIALIVFLFALIKIFKVRKHPFTLLSFSGAVFYSIVTVETIQLIHFHWKSLFILPVAIVVSWFSYSLFKKMATIGAKKVVLKSFIPTFLMLVYVFVLNIGFLFPLLVMSILTHILTPNRIKEQRRNLFVRQ